MDRGYDTRSPIQKKSSLPGTITLFHVYVYLVCTLIFVGIFFVFTHASLFTVRVVEVSGSNRVPNEDIQAYIVKALEGNWTTLIPMNSVVGIPAHTIENEITKTFPSIQTASVSREGFSKVSVIVVEKKPYFSFCEQEKCVAVDEEGIVFAPIQTPEYVVIEGSPQEFMRRSATTTNDVLVLGNEILSQESRDVIKKVDNFLESKKFTVHKILLHPLGFFDVFASFPGNETRVEFRFRDTKKIDEQIKELNASFEKGLQEKIMQGNVEYVISYVPQKVIYKNIEIKN